MNFCTGTGELRSESKRVDAGRNTVNRIACYVSNIVTFGNSTGNGTGDELAFIDPAVIGTNLRIGHADRAVENFHFRMPRGDSSARTNHGCCCCKDNFRAILDCDLHGFFSHFAGADTEKPLNHHLIAHGFFQVQAALFMRSNPVAIVRFQLMNECHIQIRRKHRKCTLIPIVLRLHRCIFGMHLDMAAVADSLNLGPHSLQAAVQFQG